MLDELARCRIIAVLRGISMEKLVPLADALVAGGIKFLEVTFGETDTPLAIQTLRARYGEKAHVGAGTVLTVTMAKQALDSGAEFILAPGMNQAEGIIRMAHERGAIVVPGAMTPTEIVSALQYGADAVKVFPASFLGPSFIRHVRGPLSHVKIIPTGGINTDNIREFFQSGAFAVGVGGNLVDADAVERGDFHLLEDVARTYVTMARSST